MNFHPHWRPWLLHFAIVGWVTGYWWASGRWEHGLWLQWIVLPAFALNADHVWQLWKEWWGGLASGEGRKLWWFGFFSLLEWQFWVTGFRTGDWWGGAGSGKDLALLVILVSSLFLLSREERALTWLWRGVVAIGLVAAVVSAFLFYGEYGVSEERFRLGWRSLPGFNAVTTGILVGFALVVGWGPWSLTEGKYRWPQWLVLALLGALLAASESRGALLAVLVALVGRGALLFQEEGSVVERAKRFLPISLPPLLGFLVYWLLALGAGERSSDLVTRGSAGRLEIYQRYLSELGPLDFWIGKGHVPSLPASELGWLVHHPHSAYLGQLVAYGWLGTLALFALLAIALWRIRGCSEMPLVLFGLTACLFDGGQMLSMLTIARWETLVVLVPLIMAVAKTERISPGASDEQFHQSNS